jgi:hypothetical protein
MGDVITVLQPIEGLRRRHDGDLQKRSHVADAEVSISYGRSRDVQSPRTVSAILADNWRLARPVIGRQNDASLGISDFDQPFACGHSAPFIRRGGNWRPMSRSFTWAVRDFPSRTSPADRRATATSMRMAQ